jgi:hypothetical protein
MVSEPISSKVVILFVKNQLVGFFEITITESGIVGLSKTKLLLRIGHQTWLELSYCKGVADRAKGFPHGLYFCFLFRHNEVSYSHDGMPLGLSKRHE